LDRLAPGSLYLIAGRDGRISPSSSCVRDAGKPCVGLLTRNGACSRCGATVVRAEAERRAVLAGRGGVKGAHGWNA
ncbi:hypothetical protein CTI14_51805, partial [Methylobacterium radiotolerans]